MKSTTLRNLFCLLTLAGMGISAKLLIDHELVHAGLSVESWFCKISAHFDCSAVASSPYSEVFGIPVASFGMSFYFAAFLYSVFALRFLKEDESTMRDVFVAFGLISLFPTLYFFGVCLFILKIFCAWCSALYLVNILLCSIALFARRTFGDRVQGVDGRKKSGIAQQFFLGIRVFLQHLVLGCVPSKENRMRTWFLCTFVIFMALTHFTATVLASKYAANGQIQLLWNQWKTSVVVDPPLYGKEDNLNRDFVVGPDSAPITVIEFSDYGCPHCRRAAEELKEAMKGFPGQVRLVFKNFPLDNNCNPLVQIPLHIHSCRAAQFARCAGMFDEELFWKASDELFLTDDHSEKSFIDIWQTLGLPAKELQTCMSDSRILNAVKRDIQDGLALGIEATPTIYVNGKHVRGFNRESLQDLFQKILAK